VIIEYDNDIGEFKILGMHNFENLDSILSNSKKFPLNGKLRGLSSFYFTGFGLIGSDNKYIWVEFKPSSL
jgi:hypothetical protein